MALLKLFGVHLNARRKNVALLVGMLLTSISLLLVFFRTPQLDNFYVEQWELHESRIHRNLKKTEGDGVVYDVELHRAKELVSEADNSSKEMCLEWVRRSPATPYFLSAVVNVRIYEEDKAKLTTRELKAWIQYLRYAGVEHVYLYDAWLYKNESQLNALQIFMEEGYITYTDWHTHNPYNTKKTTIAAYQDCINRQKHESQWQVAIDVDEYPFSPKDTSHGFLYRFVEDFSQRTPRASEITMQNFLFLGKPLDKELMIERLLRRTHTISNHLVKPIYKPKNVRANIHHNMMRTGKSVTAPTDEIRLNHYWGARLQNWGEDTSEILDHTEADYSIQPIIDSFKKCESYVRPYL